MVFGTTSAWRLAASLLLTMEAGAKAQRSAYPDSCTDPYKRATDPQCSLLFPGDGPNGYGNPDEEPSDSRAWRKGKLALGGEYWWRETGDGEPEISLTNPFDEWKVGRLEDSGREYFWRERDSEEDGMEVRLVPPPKAVPKTYEVPDARTVATFIENIRQKARLTPQALVVTLIYIDRLEARSEGVLLHARSWRPLVFASLLLASKVWHDISYWNSDFQSICPIFNVRNINKFHKPFLNS